jgi:hypothetical protein
MNPFLLLCIFAGSVWAGGSIQIYGTSSLHDWELVSHSPTVRMREANGTIEALDVSLVIETLKSGSESMDKNTYKAFGVDQKSAITFTMIRQNADGSLEGLITIGARQKKVNVIPDSVENGVIMGSFDENMSGFGIEPPTFLFGMMSTGDKVKIQYSIEK